VLITLHVNLGKRCHGLALLSDHWAVNARGAAARPSARNVLNKRRADRHKQTLPLCSDADCVNGWKVNDRTITKFGSTWAYNPYNQPAAWNCADQCYLCYNGATLAVFRTQQEKKEIVDDWALKIYNAPFWFGYSIEPGGLLERRQS
jgi:hypothetical protein